MAKEKNNILVISLIILLIGSMVVIGYLIINKNDIASPQQQEDLVSSPSPDCSISISPSSVDFGEEVTGYVWTKAPNTFCEIFSRLEDDNIWRKIAEGTTNLDGELSSTENIFVSGDFVFAALCETCRTNDDDLHVNPEIITTCTDSDGKNKMTPGWVTEDATSYYDSCAGNWAVIEYWCNGDTMDSSTIACDAGYICTETRSGDYCGTTDTPLQDGDLILHDSGSGIIPQGGQVFELGLGDLTTDGNCGLKAYIQTSWNYVNQEACTGVPGLEGVSWDLRDSFSIKYHRLDAVPVAMGVPTACDLEYDGTPFALTMLKKFNYPNCQITYNWEVDIVACNCLQ